MDYRKLIGPLVGGLIYTLYSGPLTDGRLTVIEWVGLISFVFAAIGTWLMPNTTLLAAAKMWVNALVFGLGVLTLQLADGWQTNSDLGPVLLAILTTAGVYRLPGPEVAPVTRIAPARRAEGY